MDYEKKYKEALEIAKNLSNAGIIFQDAAEQIFPELKESEDEKIKKELIECLKYNALGYPEQTRNKWIAWLEKQKNEQAMNSDEEGEKFSETLYCSALKEVDDKGICPNCENAKIAYKAGMEKQTGDKTSEDTEPRFKIGDKIMHSDSGLVSVIADIKDGEYILTVPYDNHIPIEWQSKYEIVDAVESGKVESKFKTGDWIVSTNGTLRLIEEADGTGYTTDRGWCTRQYYEDTCHLWTVEDAKPGDVLFSHETIVLYNKMEGSNIRTFFAYHYLNNEWVDTDSLFCKKDFCPATLEQCDTLFNKINESGYEWDDNKKELRKIEQEVTELPNGEDYGIDSLYHAARILEKTLGEADGYQLKDRIRIDLSDSIYYSECGVCYADLSYFHSATQNICGYVCKPVNFIVHVEIGKTMSEAVDKMHQWCIENKINGGITYTLDDIKNFKDIRTGIS